MEARPVFPLLRDYIHRFIVHHPGGRLTAGSGFFIDCDGTFLTCFHVAFGRSLNLIRHSDDYLGVPGRDELSKLLNFYESSISKTEVKLSNGARHPVGLQKFDAERDIAVFKLIERNRSDFCVCDMDWNYSFNFGDRVFFGGFPPHPGYQADKYPFAVNRGIVSSFVETSVEGGKYEHLLINAVSLGGMSGGPLIRRDNVVAGMVNQVMQRARNDVMVKDPAGPGCIQGSLDIPLNFSYATPFKILKNFV